MKTSWLVLGLGVGLVLPLAVEARDLTFEDRVRAQEAIERVRYSHQIGATIPFEEAVPRDVLEEKVTKYLEQSAALDQVRHTPVTATMLSREMERIASSSRMSARLEELYAALGNDPFFVAECLARPVLVDRLSRSFFAEDEAIRGFDASSVRAVAASIDRLPKPAGAKSFAPDTWDNASLDDAPEARAEHVAVWTGREMLVWGGVVTSGGIYDPETDTWRFFATPDAPTPMEGSTAVWTGTEMIVWGGGISTYQSVNSGARYDPALDRWTPISTVGAPLGTIKHTAVWTGTEMIVWGGYRIGAVFNTGARYDPASDTWTPIATSHAPSARSGHVAVWTGRYMVVWGGTADATGGRYDPVWDSWVATSLPAVTPSRYGAKVVWTGTHMLIWGGQDDGICCPTMGSLYDPETFIWTSMSTVGAPSPPSYHTTVWTGTELIVWGVTDGTSTGARYDPAADVWIPVSTVGAPPPSTEYTAVWAGDRMIVWGGHGDGEGENDTLDTGGRYDPSTDTWTPVARGDGPRSIRMQAIWTGNAMISWGGEYINGIRGFRYDPVLDSFAPIETEGQPTDRVRHRAVWTGQEMIVWGGRSPWPINIPFKSGGRYDPIRDRWRGVRLRGAPSARYDHVAAWTGSKMIVWGGFAGHANHGSLGGIYDPVTNTWTRTTLDGAPTGRWDATAVWTGDRMIVWGGYSFDTGDLNTGGVYDPAADRWSATSLVGAPETRREHAAVWTGNRMIVWGGGTTFGSTVRETGGVYDPVTDTWVATSTGPGVPPGRKGATAVWTGREMIVWGGYVFETLIGTGGHYDPSTDTWRPTASLNAPCPRDQHVGVWTGEQMIIWSGEGGPKTGGRYVPGP